MEQVRLLLAIALSFLVFIIWNLFFVEKQEIQKPGQTNEITIKKDDDKKPEISTKEDLKEIEKGLSKKRILEIGVSPQMNNQDATIRRTIDVRTPFYTARISEKGAVFKSFVLKDYKERVNKDSPLKELIPAENLSGTMSIGFVDKTITNMGGAFFSADIQNDSVDVTDKNKTITFTHLSGNGIVVKKKFHFYPDSYLIGQQVDIINDSGQIIKDRLFISLVDFLPDKGRAYGFEGPSILIDKRLEQIKTKSISKNNTYNGVMSWISIESRYFMSSIVPAQHEPTSVQLFLNPGNILESRHIQPLDIIEPGAMKTYEYKLFLGPKSMKILSGFENDLDKAINFGMFDVIAKPCLWMMDFLYGIIPNYGFAIIILTVMIKILLWPLGTKSYKSMGEMKKLQPLMTELREKYKDDRKKMNEELMGLYKTYKINPLGGCLPMVLQIPVFFALYRMLYQAIELRHAPFLLWINDLAAPDRLFRFDFSIPFMQPPYGIPVLTIIMGGTMFLQQKMSPPPGDPQQAKMMMFMPIIFTVIFINFSSGLVLYWLVNNVLSISQQYYITKKNA